MITDDEEVRLYHLMCDISKMCRKYFYVRKNLPRDAWSTEKVVNYIYQTSKTLNENLNKFKNNK